MSIPSLSRHSSIIHDNKLVIFGGEGDDDITLNTLYFVDLSDYTVKIKNYEGVVETMGGHETVIYNNKMYVFGGWSSYNDGTRNRDRMLTKIYYYNFDTNTWSHLNINISKLHGTGFSQIQMNESCYLFGGKSRGNSPYTNDVIKLNLKEETIEIMDDFIGKYPQPRIYHTTVLYHDKLIVICGKNEKGKKLNDVHCVLLDDTIKISNFFNHKETSNLKFKLKDETILYAHSSIFVQNEFIKKLIGNKEEFNMDQYKLSKGSILNSINYMYTSTFNYNCEFYVDTLKFFKLFKLTKMYSDYLNIFDKVINYENSIFILESINKSDLNDLKFKSSNYFHENKNNIKIKEISKELFENLFKTTSLIKNDEFNQLISNDIKYSIQDHLIELFNNSFNFDLEIISSDNVTFKVHKFILVISSVYFKMLFNSKFNDSNDNKVKIDINSKMLQLILEFVYTNNTANIEEYSIFELLHLLILSDLYMIDHLSSNLLFKIIKLITSSNAIDVLLFIEEYNVNKFKEIKDKCLKQLNSKNGILMSFVKFNKIISDQEKRHEHEIQELKLNFNNKLIELTKRMDLLENNKRLIKHKDNDEQKSKKRKFNDVDDIEFKNLSKESIE